MVEVPNYENYLVDRKGNVYSKFSKRFLTPKKDKEGYLSVAFYGGEKPKYFKIHRLVAMMFIPNPDNLPQINHKDENKANNSVENLEWCTGKYNVNYGTRNERAGKIRGYMVYCVELNKTFNSMVEAEKETGAKQIAKACRGIYSHSGGYHWKFV